MKSTIHELQKSDSNIVSKTNSKNSRKNNYSLVVVVLLIISVLNFSCSKPENGKDGTNGVDGKDGAVLVPVDPNKLVLPAFFENTTLLTIPDAVRATGECGSGTTPGTAQNTIVITKEGIIADENKITFEIEIADVFAGEVVVELINPAGNSMSLIKRIGASSPTNCGTNQSFIAGNILKFNAAFTATIPTSGGNDVPINGGNYTNSRGTDSFPSLVLDGNLSSFLKSKNIKGTWIIKVYDCGLGDICTLNSWKIKFEAGALQ